MMLNLLCFGKEINITMAEFIENKNKQLARARELIHFGLNVILHEII